MTGRELLALRQKLNLTQVQIAQLLHMNITAEGRKSAASNQVGKWERGTAPIHPALAELLRAKLYLLETQQETFENLVKYSLEDFLRDMCA